MDLSASRSPLWPRLDRSVWSVSIPVVVMKYRNGWLKG